MGGRIDTVCWMSESTHACFAEATPLLPPPSGTPQTFRCSRNTGTPRPRKFKVLRFVLNFGRKN